MCPLVRFGVKRKLRANAVGALPHDAQADMTVACIMRRIKTNAIVLYVDHALVSATQLHFHATGFCMFTHIRK